MYVEAIYIEEGRALVTYSVQSDAKINLTLRITGVLPSGYHSLVSLFLRLPSAELLTISTLEEDNVKDIVTTRNMQIEGENILEKALRVLRREKMCLSPFKIEVKKNLPPGTGLGGGSGNAAAFLSWVEKYYGIKISTGLASQIGADVPFLLSASSLALVQEIGDQCTLWPALPSFLVVTAIPKWRVATAEAYAGLDSFYEKQGGFPLNTSECLDEIHGIYEKLAQKKRVGFLPNDFSPWLLKRHPEYEDFFRFSEEQKALAYGFSGSGSSVFALFDPVKLQVRLSRFENFNWVEQILLWSDDR